MDSRNNIRGQEGFSLIEMLIAITVMMVVTGSIFSLMRSSFMISSATYEMTDAQENLRFAQEYINRDLMNAGDGLKTVSKISLPTAFVTNYLTLTPINDPLDAMPAGITNLGILTTDNNVPAATAVPRSNPALTVKTATDRQTILEIDNTFVPITPTSINTTADPVVTLPAGTTMSLFTVGEIYYISSSLGGTFGTVTVVDTANKRLTFGVGGADVYGLNLAGAGNNIKVVSSNGTLATSLQRMQMIHYFVSSGNLLVRRLIGVKGAGFRDSIIAEHVLNVQFNYSLDTVDASGNVTQPTATLTNKSQRLGVRQVEVTVTVETPHALAVGTPQLSMTTGTSVRRLAVPAS